MSAWFRTRLARMAAQDYLCDICGTPFVRDRARKSKHRGRKGKPCLDHDHRTGQVRGVLCSACNLGLGSFRDDTAILRKAAIYLEYWAAVSDKDFIVDLRDKGYINRSYVHGPENKPAIGLSSAEIDEFLGR